MTKLITDAEIEELEELKPQMLESMAYGLVPGLIDRLRSAEEILEWCCGPDKMSDTDATLLRRFRDLREKSRDHFTRVKGDT